MECRYGRKSGTAFAVEHLTSTGSRALNRRADNKSADDTIVWNSSPPKPVSVELRVCVLYSMIFALCSYHEWGQLL